VVSIIIPTYNRSELLPRAIDSVLKQSCDDWELLVVDDGSDDDTHLLMKSFQDNRVAYLRQQHRGVSAARNAGIRASRHPWVCFLDSDDYWHPRKLQLQLEEMERSPLYRLIYTDEIWIRRGIRVNQKKIHRKYDGWIYDKCLPLCIISPSSALMRRQLLEDYGGFDQELPVCEDYELWLRISAREPVRFLPRPLIYKTGGHADQLSHSLWGMDRFRVQALIKTCEAGFLTPQQKEWTAAEIVRKADILSLGYRNRGKPEEARAFSELAEAWRDIESSCRALSWPDSGESR
jgi:glycosyltransferase involved in cell wall biosynthesis